MFIFLLEVPALNLTIKRYNNYQYMQSCQLCQKKNKGKNKEFRVKKKKEFMTRDKNTGCTFTKGYCDVQWLSYLHEDSPRLFTLQPTKSLFSSVSFSVLELSQQRF